MAPLIYTAIASLDGYVDDGNGRFDWAAPTPEVHAFVNDLERPIGTYLYGRRLYDVMRAWADDDILVDAADEVLDYAALWRAADKVVYSRTLNDVTTPRTTLERDFDPAAVRRLADEADKPVTIGGPSLAAHALRAGIVDELRIFRVPVLVGAGTAALPPGVRRNLVLDSAHAFADGTTFSRYRLSTASTARG